MPKLKTHGGTKDRVKKTGTGKLKVLHSHRTHFLAGKSGSRKRTFAGTQDLQGKVIKTIKKRLAI